MVMVACQGVTKKLWFAEARAGEAQPHLNIGNKHETSKGKGIAWLAQCHWQREGAQQHNPQIYITNLQEKGRQRGCPNKCKGKRKAKCTKADMFPNRKAAANPISPESVSNLTVLIFFLSV